MLASRAGMQGLGVRAGPRSEVSGEGCPCEGAVSLGLPPGVSFREGEGGGCTCNRCLRRQGGKERRCFAEAGLGVHREAWGLWRMG